MAVEVGDDVRLSAMEVEDALEVPVEDAVEEEDVTAVVSVVELVELVVWPTEVGILILVDKLAELAVEIEAVVAEVEAVEMVEDPVPLAACWLIRYRIYKAATYSTTRIQFHGSRITSSAILEWIIGAGKPAVCIAQGSRATHQFITAPALSMVL